MQKILCLFIRYLRAGVIATSVHLMVFVCLLGNFGATLSTFCGGFTGASVSYWLSRHWVFAQRNCNRQRFAINVISQVISNTLVVALMTQREVPAHLAQLTAMAVATIQGFMFNHFWVFRHDIKREPFQ
jgi:putative flippase GtrA